MRRMRVLLPTACLALAVAACSPDEILTVDPTTVVPADQAITDPVSARSATAGLYDALQSGSYYGEAFLTYSDLLSDNARHRGTFTTYANAEQNQLTSENTTVRNIWQAIYRSISRANANIAALTTPSFVLDAASQNHMLGEAYFIRALGYHNLVKYWAGVPLVLAPVTSAAQASLVTRASVADVYTQILNDLTAAETRFTAAGGARQTRAGSLAATRALRARVLLYRAGAIPAGASTDLTNAIAAANQVIGTSGITLAPTYAELFDQRGNQTPEDIFRVRFTDQDAGSLSYFYMDRALGGRRELGPTDVTSDPNRIIAAYETGDARRGVTLGVISGRNYVRKFPSVTGTEHIHVIRLAEVILIRAEAYARLNDLVNATLSLNMIRARAGLPARVLGTPGYTTQGDVINAIIRERRIELAFEGDRWADMIRTSLADSFLASKGLAPERKLYPIPRTEIDVAPGLTQNPGY